MLSTKVRDLVKAVAQGLERLGAAMRRAFKALDEFFTLKHRVIYAEIPRFKERRTPSAPWRGYSWPRPVFHIRMGFEFAWMKWERLYISGEEELPNAWAWYSMDEGINVTRLELLEILDAAAVETMTRIYAQRVDLEASREQARDRASIQKEVEPQDLRKEELNG